MITIIGRAKPGIGMGLPMKSLPLSLRAWTMNCSWCAIFSGCGSRAELLASTLPCSSTRLTAANSDGSTAWPPRNRAILNGAPVRTYSRATYLATVSAPWMVRVTYCSKAIARLEFCWTTFAIASCFS